MKKLKLYVWHDVLKDWKYGIAFALATSRKEAWEVLKKNIDGYAYDEIAGINSFSGCKQTEPKEYENPTAFYIYGGG